MPAGVPLDWITQPEHASQFLWIRLGSALVALLMLGVAYLPGASRHVILLGAGPPLICGTGIELMILQLDGANSPYYAGLSLCILAIGVLYTWRWWQALVVSGSIVLLWLLPAVLQAMANQLDSRLFFNNLYFLFMTTVIAVASAAIRYGLAYREMESAVGLQRATRELAEAVDRLSELDRLKSEFFANISHELRTPLTLILAPVDELLASTRAGPARHTLEVIHRNAERLLRLIDDLLDLARLDAGGLRLVITPLDLSDLARKVVDAALPTAQARGLNLRFECSAVPSDTWGDNHRLEIVLTNVVSNAIKFTQSPGLITVRVRTHEGRPAVEVEDNGSGIPEQERGKIFERFYQVEGSARRRQGGAGIGLALARELVQLHGGTLTFHPAPERGSIFRMTLQTGRDHIRPEAIERRQAQVTGHPSRRWQDAGASDDTIGASAREAFDSLPPMPLQRGRRSRILIAEDQEDLREFLVDILGRHFEVIATSDGVKALERTRIDRPDLVLTDVMMPGMSGVDLCREIKKDPQLKQTPVLMLTARSGADAAVEGYGAGADDFVPKPFHARVLLARVHAHLNLRSLALQLADHSRLALAGTLAAGVAHEVRNPVNAIINAGRVLADTAPEGMSKKLLAIIDEGARRIVEIVSSLDEHVRPADGDGPSECDLVSGLESSLDLLEYRTHAINIHRSYATTPRVMGMVRELNQVFLNLLDNAVRAGPQNIWVAVEQSGDRTFVTIADDGPGVPEEIAQHVFDPFVTTRPVGQGTGLGLYLSRRIVEDHGGRLSLRRRAGGGAEFVIELAATAAAESDQQKAL